MWGIFGIAQINFFAVMGELPLIFICKILRLSVFFLYFIIFIIFIFLLNPWNPLKIKAFFNCRYQLHSRTYPVTGIKPITTHKFNNACIKMPNDNPKTKYLANKSLQDIAILRQR